MAVTNTVGKVAVPYTGNELVVTPAGTSNPTNVDGNPAVLVAGYNTTDPTIANMLAQDATFTTPGKAYVTSAVAQGTITSTLISSTPQNIPATGGLAVSGYSAVLITVDPTSYTGNGITFTFQISDDGGTTFYPIVATQLDGQASNVAFYVSGGAGNKVGYLVVTGGGTHFRVIATGLGGTIGTAPTVHLTPTAASIQTQVAVSSGTLFVAGPQTVMPGQTPVGTSVSITAASSSTFTWSTALKAFTLQNNMATPLYIAYGNNTVSSRAATLGDIVIAGGQNAIYTQSWGIAWFSIWNPTGAATAVVNGTAAGGVVLWGAS